MPEQKTYTVVRRFTDASGKEWKEGDKFQGDEKAVQNVLRQGNVQEQPAPQPS
jgi:hypothetical protein